MNIRIVIFILFSIKYKINSCYFLNLEINIKSKNYKPKNIMFYGVKHKIMTKSRLLFNIRINPINFPFCYLPIKVINRSARNNPTPPNLITVKTQKGLHNSGQPPILTRINHVRVAISRTGTIIIAREKHHKQKSRK